MYYRRWTRMHLKPGLKYFIKYGVINPKYDKYSHLIQVQNPEALQYNRLKAIRGPPEKDLDTKLINALFRKYPDLQYEPISQQKFPGQPFNTFSYAYSFINQQKKLIRQGYTIPKAFELTQQKYHERMKRTLDQSLLSRGLAFSNKARSFLNVYQQQAEYQSKLKTQRTKRELQKYDAKLNYIKGLVQKSKQNSDSIIDKEMMDHNRIFYDIKQHDRDIDSNQSMEAVGYTQIPATDSKERIQFINKLQSKFKNLFSQFYQHSASKDRLQGLTDSELIRQIQTSPSKIKRQTSQLMKYLQHRNIKVSLQNGKVVVSGAQSDIITEQMKKNKYLKIAILSEALNYEKPVYSAAEKTPEKQQQENAEIFKHRSTLKDHRPDQISREDRETIRSTKKKDFQLTVDEQIYSNKEAYKIYQTQDERLLRLEIKYYDMLISQILKKQNSKEEQSSQQNQVKELQERRKQVVEDFRRLKYRLEKRYRNISADDLLFPEHHQLGKGLKFEDETEYEELVGYLRKKNDERRLTSLYQSKDNKINKILRVLEVSEGAVAEGEVPNEK